MFVHNLTYKWNSAGAQISKTVTAIGSGEVNIDQTVDANESDLLVSFSVLVAEMKSFFAVSEVDLTVTPHDQSDNPLDQIDLVGGEPFVWRSASGQDNPFSGNVGNLHVATDSDSAGLLQIRCLVDASPNTTS